MKILKYFALLFLLTLVSLVVFILTQDGKFNVSKTFIVEAPKENVFNYIQNTKNWSEWTESRKLNDSIIEIQLNGFPYSEIQNNKSYQNDSLTQTLLTKNPVKLKWTFKSEGNKTEINFQIEGIIDFQSKIKRFWDGSPTQTVTRSIEKDLSRLSTVIKHQYTFTELETLGPTEFNKIIYIYLNQSSTINTLEKDIQKQYPKLKSFVTDYKIAADLKPILLFNSLTTKDTIKYRLALPINKNIYLNPDDFVLLDSITTPLTFKTISNGHYTHLSKALKETEDSFAKSKIQEDKQHMKLLRLTNSILDSSNPAEWKTEIYIPIITPTTSETIEQKVNEDLQ
ncbi:SRPBCC family protein [Myroides guanonis]|uniref:Polyketide cyclase / dehydrase and lipid transport n=1 Tax=Myroides guanonis TaxID=1150112 RepID=A0A1I3QQB8_9FLAO|nr:hypothetical protein [Myroides guanonis]SFJ36075.1 hypothetical protein SAMN04487893_10676 [Myroides guanonis]